MRFDPTTTRTLIATINPDAPSLEVKAPRTRPPRQRHPAMQLLDAVMRLAGPQAELLRHAERPWASATFQGTRHTIAMVFEGIEGAAAGEAFITALPEHEFTISRQIVADATVSEVDLEMLPRQRLTVEVEMLLLEDC